MQRNLVLSVLLPLAFGLGLVTRDGQGPAGGKAMIGFVDLDRLAREFPMGKEKMSALEKEAEEFKVQREADRKAIKAMEDAQSLLTQGTLPWFEAEAALQAKAEAFKGLQEARMAYLDYSQKVLSDEALMEINRAVADIAKKAGTQVVVRYRELPDANKPEFKDARRRMNWHDTRNVLYADPALDLTDEVIKVLKK